MRFTRRQALVLGIVGSPLAMLTGLGLRHAGDPGELVTEGERRALTVLSVREFATLKVAIARITRAEHGTFPTAATLGAAAWAERYCAGLHRFDLTDVRRLLHVIEHVLPVLYGTTLPFTRATPEQQDAVLNGMETSASELLRGAFAAVKQIAAMAFLRDERTWPALQYDGPLVAPRSSRQPREVVGRPLARVTDEHFDVDAVVIGAGAGGSMAAREIARAGASVLLLEEGPDHPPESFTQREDEMLAALYQDRGGRATQDRAIHVLQGRGVGGSTIHNQNLCKRAPREVLDQWRANGLVGWGAADLDPLFDEVESLLHVTAMTNADVNDNNDALRRGASVLGWRAGLLHHNRDGCRRSGFCELGCAYDGKNNARKSVIPDAVRAGARLRPDTRAERITYDGTHATGVLARDARTGRTVTVRARAVVLAASAVGSATLAIASGIPDPHARAGRGLHLHPGAVVAGVFDREIAGWRGIPQSIECTQWLDFAPESDRRVWIVPAFAHPVGFGALLPGVGPAWTNALREYPNTAVLTSMLHDETEGRVSLEYGRARIDYVPWASDRAQLALGLRASAEILLAAGASKVVFPFAPPTTVRRASDLSFLRGDHLHPHALPLTAVHPMSSMRAGADPRASVVDPRGQHHQVRGLYVSDGGLFPTSLGGPPQISIYTAGMKVGRHVVEDLLRS